MSIPQHRIPGLAYIVGTLLMLVLALLTVAPGPQPAYPAMPILVDPHTGCEYLPTHSGATPHTGADGRHICKGDSHA